MTQYYEPEANRLEHLAAISNDPVEQSRLWAEASRIGTVVEWHDCGHCEKPSPGYAGPCECDLGDIY